MQDEVRFMRIRTRRHELMISPGMCLSERCTFCLWLTRPLCIDDRYLLAVLHDPSS